MNDDHYSAWNPGLESDIPPEYQQMETIYRPENVTSSMHNVHELATQTGLKYEELVAFRPERLAVHELLIRITADIVVTEGEDERGLGRNFRAIANTIQAEYIHPRMEEIKQAHADLRRRVQRTVQNKLSETLFLPPEPVREKRGLFSFLSRKKPDKQTESTGTTQERENNAILAYREMGRIADNELMRAVYKSLYRVLNSIAATRGYIGPDQSLLAELVCTHVCNSYGSQMIGQQLAPWIEEAIEQKQYTLVSNTNAPTLISLKGASAAGKSSLRAMLTPSLRDQGIPSGNYATISPDIWRHFLLDYESLGPAYKYAGRLTSNEVIVIDGKLDRYIRKKSNQNKSLPHLLVDRFRFDSFSSENIGKILHGTYVKYVNELYMYFIVTPPETTVERGWERALKSGRYKSVEDFLDHSVEAYSGMSRMLFKWLAYEKPVFRYEFLDNNVPKGTYPRCIAYGTQGEINIVDPAALVDIERYAKINIRAKSPQQVYPEKAVLSVDNNVGFLRQIVENIPNVNFIDRATKTVYLRAQNEVFSIGHLDMLTEKLKDDETEQILSAIGWAGTENPP